MKKLLYIVLILVITGCEKIDNNEQSLNKSEVVNIGISTELATRATTPFALNSEIGLFLCKAGLFTPHTLSENTNIKAKYISTGWEYYYKSMSVALSQLSLDNNNGHNLDCYAYYPYNISVTNIKNIPFTTSIQRDLMWAVGGITDELNKDIELIGTNELKIPLNFKRVMSLLKFKFKIKNSQNGVVLNGISFEKNGVNKVYTSGVLDATTGLLSTLKTGTLTLTTSGTIPSDGIKTLDKNIIFVPTNIDQDGINIYLTINAKKLPTPIIISSIDLKAGHSYTLDITIDNYAKLTGISVDEEWLTNGESLEI